MHLLPSEKELLIKARFKSELKKIFIQHGAMDYEIPILAPIQDSATVFLSMRQQVVQIERRQSHNSDGPQPLAKKKTQDAA
jgi:hypothetical protein